MSKRVVCFEMEAADESEGSKITLPAAGFEPEAAGKGGDYVAVTAEIRDYLSQSLMVLISLVFCVSSNLDASCISSLSRAVCL